MDKRTINTLINSDAIWTSTLTVQAGQRYNTSIWIGSMAAADSAFSTPTNSTASMSLCLQRRLPGDDDYNWRTVKEWSVVAGDALADNDEFTAPYPEPETCEYRMGVKEGCYESGFLYARIGTT